MKTFKKPENLTKEEVKELKEQKLFASIREMKTLIRRLPDK